MSAAVLGVFVLLHIGNYLAGLAGQDVHRAVQTVLRGLYQGWFEPILLTACAIQMASGLSLVWRRRVDIWRAKVQLLSGVYLAFFLGIHLFAVLQARMQGIETDLAFAAAGMHAGHWKWFFAPYYGFAILAFGLHISVPVGTRYPKGARAVVFIFATCAPVLMALLAGLVTPLVIPPELLQAFAQR